VNDVIQDWRARLSPWTGTAAALANTLDQLRGELPWVDDSANVRLVRHYTQLGVLDRPVRRGKEALYSYRQLVQYLAARVLLDDGWPLAKIASETSARTTEELLSLLPSGAPNPAQALIQRFRRDADAGPVRARQAHLTAQRSTLKRVLPALGGKAPRWHDRTLLELTDWCQVLIDPARLARLTDAEARMLGEALAAALTTPPTPTLRRKKR